MALQSHLDPIENRLIYFLPPHFAQQLVKMFRILKHRLIHRSALLEKCNGGLGVGDGVVAGDQQQQWQFELAGHGAGFGLGFPCGEEPSRGGDAADEGVIAAFGDHGGVAGEHGAVQAGFDLHGGMEHGCHFADDAFVQGDGHFQIEIRRAENDASAMIELPADGGDGGDQAAVAVGEDEQGRGVGCGREFGDGEERGQVGEMFIPVSDKAGLAGGAAMAAEIGGEGGDAMLGEELHKLAIATGMFAVAVEEQDAGMWV